MPMPEFHALVNDAKKEIQEIGPQELKKMQQSGEDFALQHSAVKGRCWVSTSGFQEERRLR